jgi:hypothetical protein
MGAEPIGTIEVEADELPAGLLKRLGLEEGGRLRLSVERVAVPAPREKQVDMERVRAILDRVHALPILDPRHPDDILYDEYGLPK